MTTHNPLAEFLRRHPRTLYLDAVACDLSCVMRGKRYPIAQADKVFAGKMMLPGSAMLLSAAGESLDPKGMGFSDGDPDEIAAPIDGTLAPADWTQQPTAQVLLTLQGLDGAPYYFEPRNVLARVLAKFAELNLVPVVAFELEFYLVERDARAIAPPRSPLDSHRDESTQVYGIDQIESFGEYLHAVHQSCAAQGIAAGAMSSEYAPGQFEINLAHTDQVLRAADHCALFRRAVQCIARPRKLCATFMAKPYAECAGSGMHLHVSLRNARGETIFAREQNQYNANDALQHAIGGLLHITPEAMGIFAPNVNSYRRFAPNNYVPVRANWAHENRSVAVRIPKGDADAVRIEHRIAGADANPYLTLAAVLSGIHHGLTQKVRAAAPAQGNAGASLDETLPFDAQTAFEQSGRAQVLGEYFGARYLQAYAECKMKEQRAFAQSGKSEIDWYL